MDYTGFNKIVRPFIFTLKIVCLFENLLSLAVMIGEDKIVDISEVLVTTIFKVQKLKNLTNFLKS